MEQNTRNQQIIDLKDKIDDAIAYLASDRCQNCQEIQSQLLEYRKELSKLEPQEGE